MKSHDIVSLLVAAALLIAPEGNAQTTRPFSVAGTGVPVRKLPDTGQATDYTPVFGEDSDYPINFPSYGVSGYGTVTDHITGLMWQRSDGGEMTFEQALTYCDSLTLGGYTDWRIPTGRELSGFSITTGSIRLWTPWCF